MCKHGYKDGEISIEDELELTHHDDNGCGYVLGPVGTYAKHLEDMRRIHQKWIK